MVRGFIKSSRAATQLLPINKKELKSYLKSASKAVQATLKQHQFVAKEDTFCVLPDSLAGIKQNTVLFGLGAEQHCWSMAAAPVLLPAGNYQLSKTLSDEEVLQYQLNWGLGSYQFTRYKEETKFAKLVVAGKMDLEVQTAIEATTLVRDMVNTPAADMMPEDMAKIAKELAAEFKGKFSQVVGPKLLEKNYPMIHAVGRASVHAPRLIELKWGNKKHPRIALIGKGVAFDSGGLDIKPAAGMRYMQKDMGGGAHVLGLARMIMAAKLPVRLHVMVSAVENAVSSNAFRPGDILTARSGHTVEIDNTDAEGRLVLADAITEACTHKPDWLIDFATLTGAARIAVGTEIAAMFSSDDDVADELTAHGNELGDPVWRLPLHQEYEYLLKSQSADIVNSAGTGYAGATTAALFLQTFVPDNQPWLHFDMMAWNNRVRPGRPKGGEAMGMRTVYAWLKKQYA